MDYGDDLAALGKLNVMLAAAVTTVICVITAFNILRSTNSNGTSAPGEAKTYAIGILFIAAAFSWMLVWLCNNYRLIAQISGVSLIFSLVYTMIYGVPANIQGVFRLGF